MKITPTLNFAGSCREALHCYARAFSGEITCLITYREANDPAFTVGMTDAQLDWVYHAELLLDGQRIFLSDHADLALPVCYTNFLTLTFETARRCARPTGTWRRVAASSTPWRPHPSATAGWCWWIASASDGA